MTNSIGPSFFEPSINSDDLTDVQSNRDSRINALAQEILRLEHAHQLAKNEPIPAYIRKSKSQKLQASLLQAKEEKNNMTVHLYL